MQIRWQGLQELPPKARENAERRLRRLAEDHRDLIAARIVARPSGHHRHGGHEVHVVCEARGRELVATRTRPDLAVALDEAIAAIEREVKKLRERRRDQRLERPPLPPHLGVVDRVFREEGYGFILTDEGEQVYFHRNAVRDGLEFEALEEGQRVALNVELGDNGPQANAVFLPPPDVPVP